MFSKINLTRIITDHIKTLSDATTGKIIAGDIIVFLGLPLIFAVLSTFFKVKIDSGLINLLVTSLSIFAALLFNLLLLIYDIIKKSPEQDKTKSEFLKQIFSNISFSIMLSIMTVILLIFASLITSCNLAIEILDFLIIYFVLVFLLTLFMILKRVHILLTKEFEEKKKQ